MAPNRDMDSLVRDMDRYIKAVAEAFVRNKVPMEAGPVAMLALEMFKDYRHNVPRDVTAEVSEAEQAWWLEQKMFFGKFFGSEKESEKEEGSDSEKETSP